MAKKFISAITNEKNGVKAAESLAGHVLGALGGLSCEAAVLFLSESYLDTAPGDILAAFEQRVRPQAMLACNASGIIGDERELEMEAGISALAMHLPGVTVTPFSFSQADLEYIRDPAELLKYFDIYPTDKPKFLCLADPVSCDPGKLLELFNAAYPGSPLAGGLASGNILGAANWIYLDGQLLDAGAAGLAFHGDIQFETCVSQGCRPIGAPLAVTKGDRNILYELAGKPALEAFQEIYRSLPAEDQMLAQSSLFVGLAMDESKAAYERGDFLIRNIIGVDQTSGALSVGGFLEPGQTVQFQLRDARTSEEDLELLLDRMPKHGETERGLLLVSCSGRGRGLYGEEDHDIRIVQRKLGPVPVSGFFANGEFGPVRSANYIHGYTSSLTLIY